MPDLNPERADQAASPQQDSASQPIVVAFGLDEGFGIPLAVTISSLLHTLPPRQKCSLYVLSFGLSEDTKTRVSRCVSQSSSTAEVTFLDVDEAKLPHVPTHRLTKAAYLRLFLPQILPASRDKVLYLDSDLLVRKDIRPLWDLELGDYLLSAAVDPGCSVVSAPTGLYNWRELGYEEDNPYFNSGVLQLNLTLWRKEETTSTILSYIATHGRYFHAHDQEALNAVCGHRWRLLDMTWNTPSYYVESCKERAPSAQSKYSQSLLNASELDPSIMHFAGGQKPWVPQWHPPLQEEWLECFRTSGWFEASEYRKWYAGWSIRHLLRAVLRKLPDRH